MKPEDMNIPPQECDLRFPERFIKNTDYYNSLMMMYRCAIREIQTKLEVLDDEFSVKYNRNPISSIKTRIKKPMQLSTASFRSWAMNPRRPISGNS